MTALLKITNKNHVVFILVTFFTSFSDFFVIFSNFFWNEKVTLTAYKYE